MEVSYFWADRRKHDIDDYQKALFDSLNGIVWDDDGAIDDMRVLRAREFEKAYVELRVWPLS